MSDKPKALLLVYELQLELAQPGLVDQLKKTPGAFELAFDNWLRTTIDEAVSISKEQIR